jgi:CTP synthase (UTP-ammonia lyase)
VDGIFLTSFCLKMPRLDKAMTALPTDSNNEAAALTGQFQQQVQRRGGDLRSGAGRTHTKETTNQAAWYQNQELKKDHCFRIETS